MRTIAILMTCHNRREKTLESLRHLFTATLPEDVTLTVHLVDDGSQDGTGDAVRQEFPAVQVLQGSGSLYWAGGMRRAWDAAAAIGYDGYLWLNDDTNLAPHALISLVETSRIVGEQAIVCGSTWHPEDPTKLTYGGFDPDRKLVVPSDKPQECVFFNGNIVLVPRAVHARLGNLEKAYSHALGDFDYGIRAKRQGIGQWVAPGLHGACASHEQEARWCRKEGTPWRRLKYLYEPLGCNPFEFFVFDRRQNGLVPALWHFVTLHLRAVFPHLWRTS
jgi:GT2 family glycosyltransferase